MAHPCLLYLAPNPPDPTLPWGGLHITLVGRASSGAGSFPSGLSAAAREALAVQPLPGSSPAGWQPRLARWRIGGQQLFVVEFAAAPLLNRFAARLVELGVQNVKGPACGGSPWHLTLPRAVAPDEGRAQQVMAQLCASAEGWGAFLVQERAPAAGAVGAGGEYSWTQLRAAQSGGGEGDEVIAID